jgi:hypothetical protein
LLESELPEDFGEAMISREELVNVIRETRRETLALFLNWLTEDGLHPGSVLRRVYSVGKALHKEPWSLLSLREAGLMFGETKAAQSWRTKKIFNGYLKERGFKACKAPFQKSEEAVSKYREAAKGNHNRAGKPRTRSRSYKK